MSHSNDKLKFGAPSDAIVMACPPDINPDDDSVRYYGGLLVCESASTEWRRRIVAAVNACAGYSTEELEKHPAPIVTRLLNERDAAEKRRDELLKLVEQISKQTPEKPDYWSSCSQCERNISEAEDAIAGAKGSAS